MEIPTFYIIFAENRPKCLGEGDTSWEKRELLTLFEPNCDLGMRMDDTPCANTYYKLVWTDISSVLWLSQTRFESEMLIHTIFLLMIQR